MCKHPLKGFKIGLTAKGKTSYKICSLNTAYVWRFKGEDVWHPAELYYDDHSGKKRLVEHSSHDHNPRVEISKDFIEIPCGQCYECRLAYSRMWAERIMLESKDHEYTWFITLTYNNENLPENFSGLPEFEHLNSLFPRDMTLFLKRLRKYTGQQFRYYYAGEYGEKSARPHYHMILFGFKFDDLEVYRKTEFGDLFTSKTFEDIWGKGFCTIARCTYETAAYTARYVMKKRKGADQDGMIYLGMLPEFVRMSRRPGIARKYFDENFKEIYETDEIFLETRKGGKSFTPPRYFDALYEALDPDSFQEVKENRKEAAELIKRMKLAQTSLDYEGMLQSEEKNLIKRVSKLVRPL